jgi:hypothetical protein
MADAQLKLSRRALLGAACAVPLSRHPGLDPGPIFSSSEPPEGRWTPDQVRGDETEWQRALVSLRRAEAAVLALEGGPDEDAFGRAQDRFNALFRRLLALPAPDIAALADKPVLSEVEGLEIAVAAELAHLTYAPPALAALARDARRLSLA